MNSPSRAIFPRTLAQTSEDLVTFPARRSRVTAYSEAMLPLWVRAIYTFRMEDDSIGMVVETSK
jgi:hypothetical protein